MARRRQEGCSAARPTCASSPSASGRPPASCRRALALVSAGISAAFILGIPLGTLLGVAVGWRGSSAALALLATVSLVLIALRPPAVDVAPVDEGAVRGRRRTLVAAVTANGLARTERP